MSLRDYEKQAVWLFHGSPALIATLEPRQAYIGTGGSKVADGPPAIFATDSLDVAIFMSVMATVESKKSFWRSETYGWRFAASSIANAEKATGFVYVLSKIGFQKRSLDWYCEKPVTPCDVYRVGFADLPYVEVREIF